jgi:hypothetical protein
MNDHLPRKATSAGTEPGLQPSSNGKPFRAKLRVMSRVAALSCFGVLAVALAPHARADVIPGDEGACQGDHREGDACFDENAVEDRFAPIGPNGVCRKSTCLRVDWERSQGEEPENRRMKQVPCLKCVPMRSVKPADPPKRQASPPKPARDCSFAPGTVTGTRLIPWLAAGSFSALFLLARRRRR